VLTRRIDWYALFESLRRSSAAPQANPQPDPRATATAEIGA
jgi:hypothetical protein